MSYSEDELIVMREARLGELVTAASNEMVPAQNYSLTIKRAKLSQFILRHFEQQFSESLNRDRGFDADLIFDPLTKKFQLKQLTLGVDNSQKLAVFTRFDTLGYAPSIQLPEGVKGNLEPRFMPFALFSDQELMELLAIQQPDELSKGAYGLWRAELLQRTQGWKLQEHINLTDEIQPDQIVEHTDKYNKTLMTTIPGMTTHLRVANSEEISHIDGSSQRIQTVETVMELGLGDSNKSDLEYDSLHIHTGIELQSSSDIHDGYRQVHPFQSRHTVHHDLFGTKNSDGERRELHLSDENFRTIQRIAEAALFEIHNNSL